jgi:hypothetical protein
MSKFPEPERRQKSIFYHPDVPNGMMYIPRPYGDFYVKMFLDDVSTRIVPYDSSPEAKWKVLLNQSDDNSRRLLRSALVTNGQSLGSFDRRISEFLRLATSEMCAFDSATFEIAYVFEDEKTISAFEFFHINHTQLETQSGGLYQLVPPDVAQKRGVSTSIPLEQENLLIFRLPEPLRKQMRRFRDNLYQLSETRHAPFAMEMTAKLPQYDFGLHMETHKLALAQACLSTNWGARGEFNKESSGYYFVYKFLAFQEFKIRVRTYILSTFNEALMRIGRRLPFKGQIEVEGVPTMEDVSSGFEHLEEGDQTFKDIMDPFFSMS